MNSMAAKAVAGGALALIGLFVVKFMLGMIAAAFGLMMFLLLKVVPVLLGIAFVVWLFKKWQRSNRDTTVTSA